MIAYSQTGHLAAQCLPFCPTAIGKDIQATKNEHCGSHAKMAEETTGMSCLRSLSELDVNRSGTATSSHLSKHYECSQIHSHMPACTNRKVNAETTGGLHAEMKFTKALISTLFSRGGCSMGLVSQIPNVCLYCQESFTSVPTLWLNYTCEFQMVPR